MLHRLLTGLGLVTILFGVSFARSSGASFNGQSANPSNTYGLTALYAPGSVTATPSGHNVSLSWPAGTNGSGYQILGVANGTSSSCSSVTFASVGTSTGLTYKDNGRYSPQGTYFCYQVKTSYGTSWTSVSGNPTAAARIGVVATTVSRSNGGTSGRLDTGDKIIVTFNQALATASGPSSTDTVCAVSGGAILLGSTTTSGSCATTETVDLGTFTSATSAADGRWNATYTWTSSNKVLTVTLGTRTSGSSTVTTSGTWTFTPTTVSTKLLSSTGSFHACDTNTGSDNCLPVATGSF